MPRRYRRRRYSIARPMKIAKYSSETYGAATEYTWLKAQTYLSVVVPDTSVLGTRKVKNFLLTMVCKAGANDITKPIYFALVYIPEGTLPSTIKLGSEVTNPEGRPPTLTPSSYYEPNQNVILQGFIDSTSVYRFKTRLAHYLLSNSIACAKSV